MKKLALMILLILLLAMPVWASWKSPTGHTISAWFDEELAYDGNISTSAYTTMGPYAGTSSLALLISPSILCNQIRTLASATSGNQVLLSAGVYLDGNYVAAMLGPPYLDSTPRWYTRNLTGYKSYVIDEVRITGYNPYPYPIRIDIWEFEFNQIAVRPLVNSSLAKGRLVK